MSLRSKRPTRFLGSGSIPPLKQGARRHTGLAPPADPITSRFAPNCFLQQAIEKSIESVADDYAIGAGTGGGDVILFKEGDSQLRQADGRAERSTGDGGSKFAGQECLLRSGGHVGGDDVTVIG